MQPHFKGPLLRFPFPGYRGFPSPTSLGCASPGAGAPHATGAGPVSKVPSFYHPECWGLDYMYHHTVIFFSRPLCSGHSYFKGFMAKALGAVFSAVFFTVLHDSLNCIFTGFLLELEIRYVIVPLPWPQLSMNASLQLNSLTFLWRQRERKGSRASCFTFGAYTVTQSWLTAKE